jgi:hypothetical protein
MLAFLAWQGLSTSGYRPGHHIPLGQHGRQPEGHRSGKDRPVSANALKDETALYTVKAMKNGEVRMIGSLKMISDMYGLLPGAQHRMILEGTTTGCELYGNGRHEDIVVNYLAETWQVLGESNG